MKIVLIMPNVFPIPAVKGGATETLITNLLKENEKEGKIDFTCISVYDEKAYQLSKDFLFTNFIYIKENRDNLDLTFEKADNNFINYMDKIYEKISDLEFDFLIVEGGDITGYEYLLRKFPREKCLVHIHGELLGNNIINKEIYYKFLAISKYTKKLIMSDNIILENQIELLYNAINLDDFSKTISKEEKIKLRERFGINNEDIVILFIGRTIKPKGAKELILAFKRLKNIEKSKILIVGSANYGAKVKTQFDVELEEISQDVSDKIKFTGYIDNKDLYKIQNISDIAVVPSMWEELFGLVVPENMAAGLPLVVTNSGGIPEIVNDKCAFVVEKDNNIINNLAEKIDLLIDNPTLRAKMGEEGKKRAKLFGMENYLNNFIETMKKIKEIPY